MIPYTFSKVDCQTNRFSSLISKVFLELPNLSLLSNLDHTLISLSFISDKPVNKSPCL